MLLCYFAFGYCLALAVVMSKKEENASSLGIAAELEVAEKSIAVSALKGASKLTGPLNIASTLYDINNDCQQYEGTNLAKAVTADLVTYGVGVGIAALCVALSAPVVTGAVVGTGVACLAGWAANAYKSSQLSTKK